MKPLLICILGSFLISGCMEPAKLISSTKTELELTIVHIRPPKHVLIDMVDNKGNKYQHRSKHCNIHREYKVGSTYKVTMTENVYQHEDGPRTSRSFSVCGSYPVIPV